MPEVLTYQSLIEDVKVYADRNDEPFVAQIPRLVMLAENRLASEIHGLGTQRYVSGTVSQPTFPKPERWRETVSLSIVVNGARKFVLPRAYDYCRVYSPEASITGIPEFFADYAYEHFLLAPAPDADYAFELAYYERPLPLSESNQTSWYTRFAPQLLLYGTLLEAQPFLKRPERIPEFQALFDRAAAAVTEESNRRLQGNGASILRTSEQ